MSSETNPLAHEPFSYRALKQGAVQFFYEGRLVVTLAGAEAVKFLEKVRPASPEEAQLLMARATKNFKRGNERREDLKRR